MAPDDQLDTTATEADIAAIVHGYIHDEFMLGAGSLSDDVSLLEAHIVDSTGIVTLATYIEVTFGIDLDDDDMTTANFDTVQRIARFVAGRRAAGGGRTSP